MSGSRGAKSNSQDGECWIGIEIRMFENDDFLMIF